jgi:hypothetical protein
VAGTAASLSGQQGGDRKYGPDKYDEHGNKSRSIFRAGRYPAQPESLGIGSALDFIDYFVHRTSRSLELTKRRSFLADALVSPSPLF